VKSWRNESHHGSYEAMAAGGEISQPSMAAIGGCGLAAGESSSSIWRRSGVK